MSTHAENAKWLENIESELVTIQAPSAESFPLLVMHDENLSRLHSIAASLRSLAGEGPIEGPPDDGNEYMFVDCPTCDRGFWQRQ